MKRLPLAPGDWHCVCDRTGFRVPASQTRREWNGLQVWEKVYETRQPQDYVRGVRDDQSVPFARPVSEPSFLGTNEVQPEDL